VSFTRGRTEKEKGRVSPASSALSIPGGYLENMFPQRLLDLPPFMTWTAASNLCGL
jgi:hypothetical protein